MARQDHDHFLKHSLGSATYTFSDMAPSWLVQFNNFTVVPIEQLTDEELDFYLRLVAKGRATPIDVTPVERKALPVLEAGPAKTEAK